MKNGCSIPGAVAQMNPCRRRPLYRRRSLHHRKLYRGTGNYGWVLLCAEQPSIWVTVGVPVEYYASEWPPSALQWYVGCLSYTLRNFDFDLKIENFINFLSKNNFRFLNLSWMQTSINTFKLYMVLYFGFSSFDLYDYLCNYVIIVRFCVCNIIILH